MEDRFNKMLWELGLNNPEAREAIARTINSPTEYSIPTREYALEEGDLIPTGYDIHYKVSGIKDAEQRERAVARIKQADATTVKELAIRLNVLSTAYTLKEAEGEELTPQERTLKDLDITALAYTLLHMNVPKQAYKTFSSGEEFEAEKARLLTNIKEE